MGTRLTKKQQEAAALVAQGEPIPEITKAAGIDEATLAEWQEDAHFIAQVNRLRRATWTEVQDRLRALVPQAIDTLETAIEGGDLKAATELLKCVGLHGKITAPTGATDPEIIEVQQAEEWAATELAKDPPEDVWEIVGQDQRKRELTRERLAQARQPV